MLLKETQNLHAGKVVHRLEAAVSSCSESPRVQSNTSKANKCSLSCACDHSPTTPDIPLNIEASIWFLLHMMVEVCRCLSPKSHKVCISHPNSACSPDSIKIGVKDALLATHVCQDRQCLARHRHQHIRTDPCRIRHKSPDMSTQSRCSCKTKVPTA